MDALFKIKIKNSFEMLKHLHAFNIVNNTCDFNIHGNDLDSLLKVLTKMELNNALAFGEG